VKTGRQPVRPASSIVDRVSFGDASVSPSTVGEVTVTSASSPPEAPVERPRPARIVGLDLARAIAMFGMVVVHYTRPVENGELLDTVAHVMRGRAMPLFMLLGGVGVTLVSRRAHHPDRGLLIRAVLLLALGLALFELDTTIAIVLQSYGLFFALAPLLRRLPNRSLLGAAALIAFVGTITHQTIGEPRRQTPAHELFDQIEGVRSLVFDGFYPFFPVAAFFVVGIWLGRLDLRSDVVAARLAGAGVALGVGSVVVADRLVDWFGVDRADFGRREPFSWARLLDHEAHSHMLAWVLSALGTSMAVLGVSLLVAPRVPRLVAAPAALGSLALSFYVFQVLMIEAVPEPATTTLGEEFRTAVLLFVGFMVFAVVWKRFFRSGPLERLLRIGSG
jgi:uncharacterized membrane protein